MEGAVVTTIIIMLLVSAVIGGLILWGLAKAIGKIENAKFLNSALICLIASAIVYVVMYAFDTQIAEFGLAGVTIISLVLSAIAFIVIGKLIWNCTWMQSFKANIVWILINTALLYWSVSAAM